MQHPNRLKITILIAFLSCAAFAFAHDEEGLTIQLSFGQQGGHVAASTIKVIAGSPGMTVGQITPLQPQANGQALQATLFWPKPQAPARQLAKHTDAYTVGDDAMWGYLMDNGNRGQSERLKADPWDQPDAPLLTVLLNASGTRGFTIGIQQLIDQGAMWLPEYDAYITLADRPIPFEAHRAQFINMRTLERIQRGPEATLAEYQALWEDFGDPYDWQASWQTRWKGTTGHLTVMAATHGCVYKFAVDRWANVRPDFASPYSFRLDFPFAAAKWRRQQIVAGLPVLATELAVDGQTIAIEQFAAPLTAKDAGETGLVRSVFFSKIQPINSSKPIDIPLSFLSEQTASAIDITHTNGQWGVVEQPSGKLILMIAGGDRLKVTRTPGIGKDSAYHLQITGSDAAGVTVKLPSPALLLSDWDLLSEWNVEEAKAAVVAYWEGWLNQGAQFEVPEEAVNNLVRASLWHALVLPRHRLGTHGDMHMDLPYANTAYGQKNADWPINQAVYVDYMLYGLRGYPQVAQDEYLAMFKSQQTDDGRIGGFANWGVYSPGQLYAIAQNYLLNPDAKMFAELLPHALKTLDWCLAQVNNAAADQHGSKLIKAPLNDLTNEEREWAFTHAYFVGGLELFGKALQAYGHPRAAEALAASGLLKVAVNDAFGRAAVSAPVVQLEDGSWVNYVPTDAMTPRRMMEEWYPTDVDCGPLHLTRLGVFDPMGWLTTAMLNDHEDNLFLKNLGMANEPVYAQHANAYLLRDEPKAVIRAFYSLMACGFSHHQLTSVEHRWAWGQYYGPPSTDGAWFEIFRKMLLNEVGADTLMIGQAIPRPWLAAEKQIKVKAAPTYYGPVSFTTTGQNTDGSLEIAVDLTATNPPKHLIVRLRNPQEKQIKSVTVNGKPWPHFDANGEYVEIAAPEAVKYQVVATF